MIREEFEKRCRELRDAEMWQALAALKKWYWERHGMQE